MGAKGTRLRFSWYGPFALTRDAVRENVKKSPGVYRIRAFDADGRPLSICRANGVDAAGILHIGQSKCLPRRLKEFLRGAYRGARGHRAGREFHKWGFRKRCPVQYIRFDYIPVRAPDDRKRKDLERQLHEAYRRRYLDRPPLDGTSGQKQRDKPSPPNSRRKSLPGGWG